MAQYRKDTRRFLNDGTTVFEVVMLADQYGNVLGGSDSGSATTNSAFGEPLAVEPTPVIQLDAIYGLDPREFETYSAASGSVSAPNSLMQVSTGTSVGGYGVLRSRRVLRYRPGQGAMARFTAQFTATDGVGVAGYTQRAGLFNQENALQIGFDGEQFGILRQTGGKAHIHVVTITAPATSDGNITITLNGVATNVAVLNGDTTLEIANKVAAAYAGNTSWLVETADSKIFFSSTLVGTASNVGAFTFSGGTTGVTGTNEHVQEGVEHTNNWTHQADFNIDKLDGTGPSGMLLDPTKLNVYQIDFRWLGAGEIKYAIENPENGDMIYMHHDHYTNRNNVPHLDNPTMKIGYVAASLGGSGTDVVVSGASMMAAIEGKIAITNYTSSRSRLRSTITSSTTNIQHLFSIKNRLVSNDKINLRELILKSINSTVTSTTGTAAGTIYLYLNATNSVDHVWRSIGLNSPVVYSEVDGILASTTDVPLYGLQCSTTSPINADLVDMRIVVPPNSVISIYYKHAQGANVTGAGAGINWLED